MNSPQSDEPFFITEEIEAEMKLEGYVFEPPTHVSTMRLPSQIIFNLAPSRVSPLH